jgi:hypothetical protein
MVSVKGAEAVFITVSVTCTVIGKLPLLPLGVPAITPVPLSVKPAGNGPVVMLHEYGGTPPVAATGFV